MHKFHLVLPDDQVTVTVATEDEALVIRRVLLQHNSLVTLDRSKEPIRAIGWEHSVLNPEANDGKGCWENYEPV